MKRKVTQGERQAIEMVMRLDPMFYMNMRCTPRCGAEHGEVASTAIICTRPKGHSGLHVDAFLYSYKSYKNYRDKFIW